MPKISDKAVLLALSYIIPKDVFAIEKELGVFPFDRRVHACLYRLRKWGLVEYREKDVPTDRPFSLLGARVLEYSLTRRGIQCKRSILDGGTLEYSHAPDGMQEEEVDGGNQDTKPPMFKKRRRRSTLKRSRR